MAGACAAAACSRGCCARQVVVVGGGAGGVELALAVRHRLDAEARAAGVPADRRAAVACAPPASGAPLGRHFAGCLLVA